MGVTFILTIPFPNCTIVLFDSVSQYILVNVLDGIIRPTVNRKTHHTVANSVQMTTLKEYVCIKVLISE